MSFWKSIFAADAKAPAKPERAYSVPAGCLVYAIGDIHGRLDLLEQLVGQIRQHRAARPEFDRAYIVFLGDYVDRGFQSRDVIDYLLSLAGGPDFSPNFNHVFLAGNHEDLMLGFLEDPLENLLWLQVGGIQTLASYGIAAPADPDMQALILVSDQLAEAVPDSHKKFLSDLKTWWRAGDYLFVHAGIRPGVDLARQRRRDLLGIRQDFTQSTADFGFRVVHGHTGVPDVTFHANRVAVDTGAFATGKLSAAVFWADRAAYLSTMV